MKILIQGGRLIDPASGRDERADVAIATGRILTIGAVPADFQPQRVIDAAGCIVAPGLVETPWTRDWQAQHEAVRARAPLKRSATPDDCVEAALGLLRNRYATGHIFVVDGGLTLAI